MERPGFCALLFCPRQLGGPLLLGAVFGALACHVQRLADLVDASLDVLLDLMRRLQQGSGHVERRRCSTTPATRQSRLSHGSDAGI